MTPLQGKLFEVVPLPPLVVGLALLALGLGMAAVWARWSGFAVGQRILDFELAQLAVLAFAPTASAYTLRGARRDLRALAPVLDQDEAALRHESLELARIDRWPFLASRVGGVALGLFFSNLASGWGGERPPFGDPLLTWVTLRSVALGWVLATTAHLEIARGLRFARLGAQHVRVDLVDVESLRPFGRLGLRSVALWLGLSMLFSLLLLAPWGREAGVVFSIAFALLAAVALLLPARGVHDRIVAARTVELARIRDAMAHERDRNLATENAVDPRLSNLVAYRQLVESVRTWPFDLSTWIRFSLYVLLGLGSWLGGAVVERALGVVLGN